MLYLRCKAKENNVQINKKQWQQLNEITNELYRADKNGETIDLCRIACDIRDIIGYDYPEQVQVPFAIGY